MLTETTRQAIHECFVTKGAHKGKLKAKAPPSNTLAYAAYQGLVMVFNPYKASIFGQIMFSPEQRQVYNEAEHWAEHNKDLRFLDRDRAALEILGAW